MIVGQLESLYLVIRAVGPVVFRAQGVEIRVAGCNCCIKLSFLARICSGPIVSDELSYALLLVIVVCVACGFIVVANKLLRQKVDFKTVHM